MIRCHFCLIDNNSFKVCGSVFFSHCVYFTVKNYLGIFRFQIHKGKGIEFIEQAASVKRNIVF